MVYLLSSTNYSSIVCIGKVLDTSCFYIPAFFIAISPSLGNSTIYFESNTKTWLHVMCSRYIQTTLTVHFHQCIMKDVEHDKGRPGDPDQEQNSKTQNPETEFSYGFHYGWPLKL